MGMENTREEENKMRNETNTGKGKQAARGGRSVGRPRDGFRAGDCKTNIGHCSSHLRELGFSCRRQPPKPRQWLSDQQLVVVYCGSYIIKVPAHVVGTADCP